MKTSAYIPDDLFDKLDKLSKEHNVSRNSLICKGLELVITAEDQIIRKYNDRIKADDSDFKLNDELSEMQYLTARPRHPTLSGRQGRASKNTNESW